MRRLAVLVIMALASGAAADKKPSRIVAILDVHTEGVPPEVDAQFQKDLDAQADSKHYWLAPRAQVKERMANSTKWTEGCYVGGCLHEVKTQTGAEIVLLAALTGSGTSFGSVITLVRTDTGHVISQASERCDVCTLNEAMATATLSAVKLLSELPETLPDDHEGERLAVDSATKPLEDKLAVQQARMHRRQNAGIATLLLGIATGAAGFTLYEIKNHSNLGLATAAAGGGLALGGAITIAF